MNIIIKSRNKIKSKKPYDVIIDQTPFKNPFFSANGWNTDLNTYEFWFKSNMKSEDHTKFQLFVIELLKIEKKYGKVRLVCNCGKKHKECIAMIINEQLEML